MEALSDNYLMSKVKDGDVDKLSLLFKRYHQPIYKFAYYQLNDQALSEDIVQNVFYRLLKYKDTYSGQGEFKTWIYHIARNSITDHYRKTNKMDYKEDISTISDATRNGSIDHEYDKKNDIHSVKKALQMLNEEQRELLVMCKYQEMPYKEIATILNTNENNIKIKVHRALKELKEIYFKLEK